jgi:hypothetical protein
VKDIIKNRRKISEIADDMININKRKPSLQELDKLIDIINDSTSKSEEADDGSKRIARKRDNHGVEQDWI